MHSLTHHGVGEPSLLKRGGVGADFEPMDNLSTLARMRAPIDGALLAVAARKAVAAAHAVTDPGEAVDAALGAFHREVGGALVSLFVLDHGRLWLVAQRGHGFVPDGIRAVSGVMGRSVRLEAPQLVHDVAADPDYVAAVPGVVSELAVPLRARDAIAGVLNVEADRPLPQGVAEAMQPLAEALAPHADALRSSRTLDLAALARLFAHLGSLRDPTEIAALAAASLAKVLPVETSTLIVWDEAGLPSSLAGWRRDGSPEPAFSTAELEALRVLVDPTAVCQVIPAGRARASVVWLPLRANAAEIGGLVARGAASHVDPAALDTAAVLAAHAAASLDAAFALRRERRSATTDSLTGILNRRGLEEVLERELASSQERRDALSLLVLDCDDFKDINDRAGHEFGDSLLREIADALSNALTDDAVAARLGGDEFVVMLPGADTQAAEQLGAEIRNVLSRDLTDAGFPLRISIGLSTYPYDGSGATDLLRAADQALYAAKSMGKDRLASFRELSTSSGSPEGLTPVGGLDARRRGRGDGSVLSEAVAAAEAIGAEASIDAVCNRLCKSLVFVVGATACAVSRVQGEYLVDATGHALRQVSLGEDAAYRISDFPLSAETLRTGTPCAVSFVDSEIDPAEAFILRELGMNALLMLPLRVDGESWGLVELYEMRFRAFSEDDIAVAQFLTRQAELRLAGLGRDADPAARPPLYELPSEDEPPLDPWTR